MLNFYDFIQVYVFTTNHHLKRANKQFSIDDSATHPSFESHLLSTDKDMKFPVVLPIFKEGRGYRLLKI